MMSSPTIVSGKVFKMHHLRFWFRGRFWRSGIFGRHKWFTRLHHGGDRNTRWMVEWSVPIWDHPAWSQLCRVEVAMLIERFDDIWVPAPQNRIERGIPPFDESNKNESTTKANMRKLAGSLLWTVFLGCRFLQSPGISKPVLFFRVALKGSDAPTLQRLWTWFQPGTRAPPRLWDFLFEISGKVQAVWQIYANMGFKQNWEEIYFIYSL